MKSNPKLWLKLKASNGYLVARHDGAVDTNGDYKEKAGTFAVEADKTLTPLPNDKNKIWVALKTIYGHYVLPDDQRRHFTALSNEVKGGFFQIIRTASSICDHGRADAGSPIFEIERGMGTFQFLKYMLS